ncbi:MAG: nicotinate phosphoribosyltransferase [Cytophagales bacterium]|nr:nicotinate phosphoribosyltransferase [Cytophagales bacterium]
MKLVDHFSSPSLQTDFYQLTMAYGHWKQRKVEDQAVFHLYFRKLPFSGGYAVACGLDQVIQYIQNYQFSEEDICFLRELSDAKGKAFFCEEFLSFLRDLSLNLDIDAMPEGTVVFPYEPLLRVQGSIICCQLIETYILNVINFQTLIATKASRMYVASRSDPILEFGLRRTHGTEAGLWASRATYIGGVSGTSHVAASRAWQIPLRGTHAHSWIMSFDHELEAFRAYASSFPENCILLIDTYDTLEGLEHALVVAAELREQGKKLLGVRIDSGDLAYFSQQIRKRLDAESFHETQIVASGDLDEHIIHTLKEQNACISIWGVGTRLVTGDTQPSLGGVYKLSCYQKPQGKWKDKIKVSNSAQKINIPGIQQIKRFIKDGKMYADMIYDIRDPQKANYTLIHPVDETQQKSIQTSNYHEIKGLLVPIFRRGKGVYQSPSLQDIRRHHLEELKCLDSSVKRLTFPHLYPVGLEKNLHEIRKKEILRRKYKGDQG